MCLKPSYCIGLFFDAKIGCDDAVALAPPSSSSPTPAASIAPQFEMPPSWSSKNESLWCGVNIHPRLGGHVRLGHERRHHTVLIVVLSQPDDEVTWSAPGWARRWRQIPDSTKAYDVRQDRPPLLPQSDLVFFRARIRRASWRARTCCPEAAVAVTSTRMSELTCSREPHFSPDARQRDPRELAAP